MKYTATINPKNFGYSIGIQADGDAVEFAMLSQSAIFSRTTPTTAETAALIASLQAALAVSK